jgi:acyl-CoA reductase-like NAD-dependent aldehyde dehydrogenase
VLHRELLIGGHFFGGPCDQGIGKAPVRSPYDGRSVGSVAEAGLAEMDAALDAATEAFKSWRKSTRLERIGLLRAIASAVRERSDELVELMALEIGKPLGPGKAEVARLALTFDLAADLLTQPSGRVWPADYDGRGAAYRGIEERFPIGPVLGVVPYNWPYMLASHKAAPAIASGNTIVLKPSPQAALCTLTLARLIHEAGCPAGVVNAVNCDGPTTQRAVQDPRTKIVSFTGSDAVGWHVKGLAPEKRVTLELGGDASAIVLADADLDWAAQRCCFGAFAYAGQVCISVQHALAVDAVYEGLRDRVVAAAKATVSGDPTDPSVLCGPMISSDAADRVMAWIDEAVAAGASVLCGGGRTGNVIEPTVLEGVPDSVRLACEEVFGPVLVLRRVRDLDEAIVRVNASPYGIHCGVFTRDLRMAERAFQELEVAGVLIDDSPTLRFDTMPYGGVKRSGFGREGLHAAYEEMTEPKVMLTKVR